MLIRNSVRGLGSIGLAGMAVAVAMAGPGLDRGISTKSSLSPSDARARLRQQNNRFIENAGQWDAQARFLATSPNVNVWLTADGVTYDFHKTAIVGSREGQIGQVVKMSFVGGSTAAVSGIEQQRIVTDFVGANHGRTARVRSFSAAINHGIYAGIDMKSYFDHGQPRYDLVVAPGARPEQIKIDFKGANGVVVEKERLALGTQLGQVFQGKLFAYQMVNGAKKPVKAEFVSAGKSQVALHVGSYDKSRELIIDPLVYGSYYGGDDGMDEVTGVTSDAAGGTYLTGWTLASQFPILQGPYGVNLQGLPGMRQAFLSKLQGDAYNHDYCAFIPGTMDNYGAFVQVDPFGNVWVAGRTQSADFPGNTRTNVLFLKQTTSGAAGTATGGTFQLTYQDQARKASWVMPFNITAAAMKTQIESNPSFTGTVASLTSSNGGTLNTGAEYRVEFRNSRPGGLSINNNRITAGGAEISQGLPSIIVVSPTSPALSSSPTFTRRGSIPLASSRYSITFDNTALGGSSQTTANINPSTAEPNAIQAALVALSNIGAGNATTTGGSVATTPITASLAATIAPGAWSVNNGAMGVNPVYGVTKFSDVFVIQFKKTTNGLLDPLPTQSLFFGGDRDETLAGFSIMPSASPQPGDPVTFVFGGTVTSTIGADIPAAFPGITSGYIARYQYVGGAFTQVASGTQYIGGNTPVDLTGIVIDREGSIYLAGTVKFSGNAQLSLASTSPFPATPGIFSNGNLLRNNDIFIQKQSGGGAVLYSGVIGGNSDDRAGGTVNDLTGKSINTGSSIAIDNNLNAYVVGVSTSFDFPRTRGVYGEVFNNNRIVTVTKISADGSQIVYSTNLKTTGHVDPAGIAVDLRGYAFVTGLLSPVGHLSFPDETGTPGDPNEPNGYPNPPTVPVTPDALDPTYDWPATPDLPTTEGFLFVLNDTATADVYSTYIGGLLDEFIYAPYVDQFGDVWVFGSTDSARNFVRVSSTGTVTQFSDSASLPASLISPLAFKASGDAAGSTSVSGILYGAAERFMPSVAPSPQTITASYNRDGFLIKQRVGQPSVASVTVNPATAPGGLGTSISGTVTLTSAAPASGADITLTLSNGAAASFDKVNPQSTTIVTVAPGATTATFTIFTLPVTVNTNVQVQATYQGSFKIAQFVVVPWLQQLTLVPNSIVGGNLGAGKITLSAPAPAAGVDVALLTDTASIIGFAGATSVTVPAGQTTVTFVITTTGVDVPTFPTITASALGVGKTQTLQVTPANLLNMTFAPPRVAGGTSSTGTIQLDGATGTGFSVTLTGPGAGYTYPSTVTFAAGATSATFTVGTPYVAANTSKTFTATRNPGAANQQQTSANLFIDTNAITKFTINPTTVSAGGSATGTITISAPAPANGVFIALSSASPLVTLPATALIPAGSTTGTFTINANVSSTTGTAAINATYGPTTLSANLTVQGVTFAMAISPNSVVGGSANATGTITLAQAASAGGLTISLSSSDPSVAVPLTVTVPSGSTTATFPVTTAAVSAVTQVTVNGVSGSASASATITVRPVGIGSVTLTPNTVRGGGTTTLRVTLEAPAINDVTLTPTSSVAGVVTTLPTIKILKGQTTGSTTVVSARVSRNIATVISVAYNSTTGSAVLTVTR